MITFAGFIIAIIGMTWLARCAQQCRFGQLYLSEEETKSSDRAAHLSQVAAAIACCGGLLMLLGAVL
jgi:hypothetical protein